MFYKTSNKEILMELQKIKSERKRLIEESQHFCQIFCADIPLYSMSFGSLEFAALKFKQPKDAKHWTLPDKKDGHQRLRTSIKKASIEEKEAHKLLLKKWQDNCPNSKVSSQKFYEMIGTSVGNIMFNGMAYFEFDNVIYIKTPLALNDAVTEILGSEYQQKEAEQKEAEFDNPSFLRGNAE